ncbi:MAG: L,D-transpeptidase family protein [Eubacterium sp.]
MKKSYNRTITLVLALAMIITLFAAYLEPASAASSGKYWLKVNQKRNVITAYEKIGGKWKPVRAMLCSTGVNRTPETTTYNGTWRTSSKKRWLTMSLDGSFFDYGQYTAHLYGGIFIHSVWYYAPKHNAQARAEFNKLGRKASHGCIRVSTADAKWMYDNCPAGTKVTVYSSSKSGPLGKPKAIKVPGHATRSWDPTDPAKGNPLRYLMPKPVIKVKKPTAVAQSASYNLLSGVTAKDPNSFMSLTKYVKVAKLQMKAAGSTAYKKISTASFSTNNAGTYVVTYYVNDPWGRSKAVNFKFVVKAAQSKPSISGAADRTVETGSSNAVSGITGKQGSADRTSAIQVTIKDPSGKTSTMSYSKAAAYVFSEDGNYTVTYALTSTANKKVVAKASVTITAETMKEVPDVKGKTEAEAKETLEKAGFTVQTEYTTLTADELKKNADRFGDASFGQVYEQTTAGSKVKAGSTVTIKVLKEEAAASK